MNEQIHIEDFKEIEVKTSYFEIEAPFAGLQSELPENTLILKLEEPDISFYMFVYRRVGDAFGWTGRIRMKNEELKHILHSKSCSVFILYYQGAPEGFFELNAAGEEAEIVYFGLTTGCIGKGLGKVLMDEVFRQAKALSLKKLWLHTCEKDSPAAIPFYQKCGFRLIYEKMEKSFYPIKL